MQKRHSITPLMSSMQLLHVSMTISRSFHDGISLKPLSCSIAPQTPYSRKSFTKRSKRYLARRLTDLLFSTHRLLNCLHCQLLSIEIADQVRARRSAFLCKNALYHNCDVKACACNANCVSVTDCIRLKRKQKAPGAFRPIESNQVPLAFRWIVIPTK